LERRVIAYDLRGHGQSTLGVPDGTLTQLAGDLVALLDALELERPDLCGFSLGGTVVLRAAADHPERVRRLLPVATSSRVGRGARGAGWRRPGGRGGQGPRTRGPPPCTPGWGGTGGRGWPTRRGIWHATGRCDVNRPRTREASRTPAGPWSGFMPSRWTRTWA